MLAMTETWLHGNNDDAVVKGTLCPTGYDFIHTPRLHTNGGGVGLLFKTRLKATSILCDSYTTFELMDVRVRGRWQLRVLIVYRPPESTYSLFYEEFSRLLENVLAETPGHLMLIGDFNFHMDDPLDRYALRFSHTLEAFDLKQHVRGKTHKDGHTLDLVITKSSDESLIKELCVRDPVISDHCAIHCNLWMQNPEFTN